MESGIHWSVWLASGVAAGLLPIFGENRILGLLQTIVVLSSPAVIFTVAGSTYLPFVLFYGGLTVATSFAYRRKKAKETAKLQDSIAEKKRRWS